ncbi:MAG: saccharopine dehydrogenase NADP-binding domain-containing protein, partial [Saprospiraceae bacterium]|nr:saccharopine dehydrogenase NADP-binding domain-containing protein [Saprospiraceae bacterium]
MENRKYDVVILGATGFTGRLVAEYLLKTYGVDADLQWAMAGRSGDKLATIRKALGNDDIPTLVADTKDAASLDQLASQTKVVCTTVGPYAKYGSEVVAACVRQGTHYCDLAGEVHWIRRMIDTHHEAASAKNLKIVHCCGYDSIPSDMGVYWLQKQVKENYGAHCQTIKSGVKASKGGLSGGTVYSMTNILAEAQKDKSIYGTLINPYGLNPEGEREGPDGRDLATIQYDSDFKSWTCPFMMAAINTKVVRRGHAVQGYPYGKSFSYSEVTLTGDGFSGRMKGVLTTLPLGVLMKAKPGSFAKRLVDRFAPKPGQGPDQEARETGFWVFDQVGILPDGTRVRARLKGDRDPGNGSTSKMLGEAAVCLAKDNL